MFYFTRFSPEDSILAVGGKDNSIDFFEFNGIEGKIMRNGYCTQVPGSVLQMDWSNDSKYIRVGTSEFNYVIYEAPSGNQIKDSNTNENITWDQWSR